MAMNHSSSLFEELASNGKEKYTCEICGKVYLRPWSYYSHMREHAAGDKNHTCEICNKQFQNVNNLKQHMLIHTGNVLTYLIDLSSVFFVNDFYIVSCDWENFLI